MKAKKSRPHFGLINKKKLFIEGFVLLRRLGQGPLSRNEAETELGIPYREWYRWLQIFKLCDIPLAEDYRVHKHRTPERTIRLWPQDWRRLIESKPKQKPRGK